MLKSTTCLSCGREYGRFVGQRITTKARLLEELSNYGRNFVKFKNRGDGEISEREIKMEELF